MISLESEIMSNSYDPPGLLDGLGSGCRADAGPATSPSSIEGRGTASKDGGVKPRTRIHATRPLDAVDLRVDRLFGTCKVYRTAYSTLFRSKT